MKPANVLSCAALCIGALVLAGCDKPKPAAATPPETVPAIEGQAVEVTTVGPGTSPEKGAPAAAESPAASEAAMLAMIEETRAKLVQARAEDAYTAGIIEGFTDLDWRGGYDLGKRIPGLPAHFPASWPSVTLRFISMGELAITVAGGQTFAGSWSFDAEARLVWSVQSENAKGLCRVVYWGDSLLCLESSGEPTGEAAGEAGGQARQLLSGCFTSAE